MLVYLTLRKHCRHTIPLLVQLAAEMSLPRISYVALLLNLPMMLPLA